jgi:nitrate reductase beta subunit
MNPIGDPHQPVYLQMGSATPTKGLPVFWEDENDFSPKWRRTKKNGDMKKRFLRKCK